MKKIFQILTVLLIVYLNSFAQNNSPFVRFPAINSNGSEIAFVYQGDIWKVKTTGGEAYRLTIHEAYDETPQWSPDDSKIAFVSGRWGNNDIFVMNSNGGDVNRITYHSTGDMLNDWTNSDELLFTSNRTFRQVEWESEIYLASPEGGTPKRFMNSLGGMPVMSPDGNYIAFVKGNCRITREAYEGAANREVWLYDINNDSYKKITESEANDIYPRWGENASTLYLLLSHGGIYNIFRRDLNDDFGIEQLTDFKEHGIRYYNISKDGKHIVFERETGIYHLNTTNNEISKIDIKLGSDYRFDPYERKTYSGNLNEYSVSPNGKLTVLEIHGEIFITENDKDKSKTVNITNHPYRDQHPQWLSDTTIVFISDRDGQKDLYLLSSANEKESNLFKCMTYKVYRITSTDQDEDWPIISPDKKKISYEVNRGKLVVQKIAADGDLSSETILLDGWAIPGNVAWSPDSKWLAYSLDDLTFNPEIFIHSADGTKEPVNVSMHPKNDGNPVWSIDGSKLAWVSDRNNRNNDIWYVWLSKEDWQKTKQDWEEDDDEGKKDKKKDKKKKGDDSTSVEPIKIDFDKIHERITQVTSMPGSEGSPAFSKDGETIYFVTGEPATSGRDLYKVKFDGTKVERITKGGKNPASLSLADEGKFTYMVTKGGKLSRLKDGGTKLESLPFSGKMVIEFTTELNQIFDEAWRALREGFYDPNYHGQDWEELKSIYKPMALKASTKRDFQDVFNIMLGQVNASHMGLRGGENRSNTQSERTGLLGVEVLPVSDGIQIERVIPNSPADRETSKLVKGDKIISVDGVKVNSENNFYKALADKTSEKVILDVENSKGENRTILIRPARSLRGQLYDEWVDNNRKLVDKYSSGKLGYLHIQAMGWSSFERFERELTAAGYGKEGIVIDVRYNGGGWTTDFLMTVLNVKQHAYTIPRGAVKSLEKEHKKYREFYPYSERLPYAAWTKPSIALCNESSYSNAEIFSHAFKTLGIGKLVGIPTFGAVISTGGHGLIDGSYVRMPFRAWYVKATDENMEFGPAVPDFILENAPDSKAKGKDEQLKKAVDELLKEL